MPTGTVIWLHPTAGFGFVRNDRSEYNIYAPNIALNGDAAAKAVVGQRVEFGLEKSELTPKAIDLRTLRVKPRAW